MSLNLMLDVLGVGFGTIWLDITVNAVLINTNISISSIMNKHFRDGNFFKMGICYQRGLLLSGIYLILVTPIVGQSSLLFRLFRIDDTISGPAVYYAYEVLPGAWSFAFFDITKCYLQSMNIYYPLIVIQFFTAIIHFTIARTLIIDYGLAMRGAAWAKNISDSIAALLVYFYVIKVAIELEYSTILTTPPGLSGIRQL